MRKFLPLLILIFAPAAKADITHKLSSSVQLQVNAAATNVERVGTSYSVSGNNVNSVHTEGGSAQTLLAGQSSGVDQFTLSAVQATAGESSVTKFYSRRCLVTSLQLQVCKCIL